MFHRQHALFVLVFSNIVKQCFSIFQAAAHGTDITTGNHQISSHPVSSAREPQVSSDQGYTGATMDSNHNTMVQTAGSEQTCARPGCSNTVTKAEDGTQSTYCSSQCVMGQCRSVINYIINEINYALITEMLTQAGSSSSADHRQHQTNPLSKLRQTKSKSLPFLEILLHI